MFRDKFAAIAMTLFVLAATPAKVFGVSSTLQTYSAGSDENVSSESYTLVALPPTALGTPAGRKPLRLTVGQPTDDGVLKFKIRVRRDLGYFSVDPNNNPIGTKDVRFEVSVNILKTDTPEGKAIKIRDAIHAARDLALIDDEGGFDIVIGEGRHGLAGRGLIFMNRAGFRVLNMRVEDNTTGEDDSVDHFDPNETASSTLDGMGLLASYDLTGIPAGGQLHVNVDDVAIFSLDTGLFGSAQELELALAQMLSEYPLISVTPSTELILEDSDDSENPFDGHCLVLRFFGATSYGFQLIDGGLGSRQEFVLDPRVDEIGTTYCALTPSSTGAAGTIWAEGSTDLADNYLVLHVEGVPNQFGLFFAGPNQTEVPFGEGTLCVSGGFSRISTPQRAQNNQVSQAVVAAITVVFPNCQYWYRDPQGGGANFNLSNAVNLSPST